MKRRAVVGAGLLLAALSLTSGAAAPEAGFKVIVNPTNPVESLNRTALSDIFLKKTARWPSGLGIMPVDALEDAPLRATFAEQVHKKTVAALRNYWEKELASGSKVPPLHKSEADALTYVKVHAGAIAYISKDTDAGKLKVVPVD